MRVAINGKPAFEKARTGIEEYTYQLLRQWAQVGPKAEVIKIFTQRLPDRGSSPGQTLEDYFGGQLPDTMSFEVLRAKRLWTQLRLGWALLKEQPDVFFNPMQILPRYAPPRSVVTVHDLGYEYFPQAHSQFHFRYLRLTTQDAVKRARAVIAVSENTKQDLINRYGVPRGKIVVIHHGFSQPDLSEGRSLSEITKTPESTLNLGSRPYFLYLGRLEARKNLETLFRAFEILKFRQQLPHQLILAGQPGFGYAKIKAALESSPARGDIKEVGHIHGAAKFRCLKGASALVLASWYEGFGLPVLEAQSLGVPVVASAISSLPEVGGQGAVYVDPKNEEALADALYKLVSFPQFRAHYIQHGFKNTRRFSWRATAEATWRVIEDVARARVYFE